MAKSKPAAKQLNETKETPKAFNAVASFAKQLLLTLISIFIIFVLFKLERNALWLEKIKNYYADYKEQKRVSDWDIKMQMRNGYNYIYPNYIKSKLTEKDTFLLPPRSYITKYDAQFKDWPHPNYFYYMAGKIPTIEVKDTAKWYSAKYTAVYNENKQLALVEFQNRQMIEDFIKEFNKK